MKQNILHFLLCSFAFEVQRTFVALCFVLSMIEKNVQFGFETRENLKVFSDKVPFGDRHIYPSEPTHTNALVGHLFHWTG